VSATAKPSPMTSASREGRRRTKDSIEARAASGKAAGVVAVRATRRASVGALRLLQRPRVHMAVVRVSSLFLAVAVSDWALWQWLA
jgi:hypothetical protein